MFVAFVLYALGQSYYWPCVLGFTSERYPNGGALTLNTVSAIGLLSAGIVDTPLLGSAFDSSIHATVAAQAPQLEQAATGNGRFMWMEHERIDPKLAKAYIAALPEAEQASVTGVYQDGSPQGEAQRQAGRDVLRYGVRFPLRLFFVFGLIALYFRSKGGYRPVELNEP